jgi:hypothetical protein
VNWFVGMGGRYGKSNVSKNLRWTVFRTDGEYKRLNI